MRAVLWALLAASSGLFAASAWAAEGCDYLFYFLDKPAERIPACALLLDKEQDPAIKSRILLYRASLRNSMGDSDAVLADTEQAIQLNPNNAQAYKYRGDIYADQKHDLARALADYTRAIELGASDIYTFGARSNIHVWRHEYEAATADLDAALKLDATSKVMRERRGDVWRLRGDYQKAIADYEESVRLGSTSVHQLGGARAVWALGPMLAPNTQVGPKPLLMASAEESGTRTVELWNRGASPSHCAFGDFYEDPGWALARNDTGYGLTMSHSAWAFTPGSSYPVTLRRSGTEQAATATAVDTHTVGIPIGLNTPLAQSLANGTALDVKAATATFKLDIFGPEVESLDACWTKATTASASNSFGAIPGAAPSENPFPPPTRQQESAPR